MPGRVLGIDGCDALQDDCHAGQTVGSKCREEETVRLPL